MTVEHTEKFTTNKRNSWRTALVLKTQTIFPTTFYKRLCWTLKCVWSNECQCNNNRIYFHFLNTFLCWPIPLYLFYNWGKKLLSFQVQTSLHSNGDGHMSRRYIGTHRVISAHIALYRHISSYIGTYRAISVHVALYRHMSRNKVLCGWCHCGWNEIGSFLP